MGLKPTKIEGLEGSEVKVGTGCSAGAYETDAAGNGWEEEWTPRIRQGALDECKLEGKQQLTGSWAFQAQKVLKIRVRGSGRVLTPARAFA